jgi:dihydrofolate reductase
MMILSCKITNAIQPLKPLLPFNAFRILKMKDPRIALMVAMAQNRCIGINNTLPWHLPQDLRHFKTTTLNKPVIMRRKTFESIGRPLPQRTNIMVTRNLQRVYEGVQTAATVPAAIQLALECAVQTGANEIIVIGGEQIYREALPQVSRIYLTRVHASIEGDAYFPEFNEAEWQQVGAEQHQPDDKNPYGYGFECWDRLNSVYA